MKKKSNCFSSACQKMCRLSWFCKKFAANWPSPFSLAWCTTGIYTRVKKFQLILRLKVIWYDKNNIFYEEIGTLKVFITYHSRIIITYDSSSIKTRPVFDRFYDSSKLPLYVLGYLSWPLFRVFYLMNSKFGKVWERVSKLEKIRKVCQNLRKCAQNWNFLKSMRKCGQTLEIKR